MNQLSQRELKVYLLGSKLIGGNSLLKKIKSQWNKKNNLTSTRLQVLTPSQRKDKIM